jgi:hypothetical protein
MTTIAIAPMHNSPGKRDATGAFLPEARAFARFNGGKVLLFDNRKPTRERLIDVIDGLRGQRAHCVAFFCHGLKGGIQVGANLRNVHVLAAALRDAGASIVPLYACDAARDADNDRGDDNADGPGGVGGFASALASHGFRVDAHTTTAHTTKNPHVRRFDRGPEGYWLVEPGSAWWPTWRAALRDDPGFRLSFPLWEPERLLAELARRRAA